MQRSCHVCPACGLRVCGGDVCLCDLDRIGKVGERDFQEAGNEDCPLRGADGVADVSYLSGGES